MVIVRAALFGQPTHVGPGVIGPDGSIIPGNGDDRIPLTPVQWHLHTPSEHSVNGAAMRMGQTKHHLCDSLNVV